MNYMASFHTDIKIENAIKLDILTKDKIVSTGYHHNIKNRPLNTARKMNSGDNIIIRLLSYKNAIDNPDEPYLISTKINEVNKFKMSSLVGHKEILLPIINNINTKTYKNKRHNWFDQWNIDTIIFGIKVNMWTEHNIFTYNDIENELDTSYLYKVGNFKTISSTYQIIN